MKHVGVQDLTPRLVAGLLALVIAAGTTTSAQTRQTLIIRGKAQQLHIYGTRGGTPVVVSSGDGGWIHLGPHVAEFLAARGYFVVGLDVKDYLSSFTSGTVTLKEQDPPGDYGVLADFASTRGTAAPILIGVSAGAGLSVLAATSPTLKTRVGGVIALGLPERVELGWRFRDSLIYITKGTPDEPLFHSSEVASRVAPLPLALIHSTHDEFAPLAEARRVMERAAEPKRLWVIDASDHSFANARPEFDRTLIEALEWVGAPGRPRRP